MMESGLKELLLDKEEKQKKEEDLKMYVFILFLENNSYFRLVRSIKKCISCLISFMCKKIKLENFRLI
jgi:hypothetical protein